MQENKAGSAVKEGAQCLRLATAGLRKSGDVDGKEGGRVGRQGFRAPAPACLRGGEKWVSVGPVTCCGAPRFIRAPTRFGRAGSGLYDTTKPPGPSIFHGVPASSPAILTLAHDVG